MLFANNSKNERIYIDDIVDEEDYYCPICHNKLITKKGSVRIHHFAHQKGSDCCDHWHYEMTQWHMDWQRKYPAKCQEVVLSRDGIRHRADICISGTIIEFQHSPINMQEFQDRNDFYTGKGYKLIWLFDGSSCNKTSDNINVHIYIQEADGITDLYGTEHYDEDEFVKLSSIGRLGRPKLYHSLYLRKRTNGETEFLGCQINRDGFAPTIREFNRTACDECEYCLYFDFVYVKCMGRFRDYDINTVIEWKDDKLTYVDYNGIINEVYVNPPKLEGKSIIDLAYEYKKKEMLVRNIRSGYAFKIVDPIYCFEKYNKIYGYGEKRHLQYYRKSVEILHANEPYWIIDSN